MSNARRDAQRFERLLRMEQLTVPEYAAAGARLEKIRRGWRKLQPTEGLRAQAETFLMSYPLKSADALQLAAAWVWCSGNPQSCVFNSGDTQLLEAARQVGFQIVAANLGSDRTKIPASTSLSS